MTAMSNDQWDKDQRAAQWNNGQGEAAGQPSGGDWTQGEDLSAAQSWDQPTPQPDQSQGHQSGGAWAVSPGQNRPEDAQPQPSAPDWNTGAQQQGSANEWTSGAQQQPSASDWHGEGQQQWNTGAQQQPSAANWRGDGQQQWNTGGQQGMGQDAQGWNQNPHGGFAPGQQWQPQQPPREATGLGNLFDLSFKRFVLPSGGGIIFMVAAIGFLVKWLFDLIFMFSYAADAADVLQVLIGGLALTLVYILLTRAFLEGMSALVSMSKDKDADKS